MIKSSRTPRKSSSRARKSSSRTRKPSPRPRKASPRPRKPSRTSPRSSNRSRKSIKKTQFIEDIINMLKKNNDIYDFLFNLLLVNYGARKAYLLESVEFGDKISDILELLKFSDFSIEKDILSIEDYPRYWITKDKLKHIPEHDEEIGHLLGMKNPGGNYGDSKNKRVYLTIIEEKTNTVVKAEILMGDKNDKDNKLHAKSDVNKFNKVMRDLNLPYKFIYKLEQDDGTIIRFEEMKRKNIKYIKKNRILYRDDLYNNADDYISKLFISSINDKKLFSKYLPLFMYVYQIINEEILSQEDDKIKLEYINEMFRNI